MLNLFGCKKMPKDWAGIPVIKEVDTVILGGSRKALMRAQQLAQDKKRVLLLVTESYLLPEIGDTFQWERSFGLTEFLPEEAGRENIFLPDAVKKAAEDFCSRNGIDLLYGVYPLDGCIWQGKKCLRIAAKGGVFMVFCRKVLAEEPPDCGNVRTNAPDDIISYVVLMQEKGKEAFETLKVSCRAPENERINSAACLERMQKLALDAFEKRRKENKRLILGRFAPKAFREDTAQQPIALPAEKDGTFMTEKISFYTGNEFLNSGRYPFFGGTENAARQTSIMAEKEAFDVVVVGGGTAGAMAALYAARGGAKTVLVEPQYVLGGTATVGGVSTYWFGSRFKDVAEIDRETDLWMERLGIGRREGIWSSQDDFHPGIRAFVLQKLCREAGVEIRYGQLCFGAVCEGKVIRGVVTAGDAGIVAYLGETVIDATGDADVAVFCGARSVYGSKRDCITYWASLAQYTGVNTYRNNFSTMVIEADPIDMTRFILQARRLGEGMFDHGRYVSMRESRHLLAKTVVTLKDLMEFRTWDDALYTCYSNYDPKGKLDADLIYCGVLPPQVKIQIPLSALIPCREDGQQIAGLYVAGKAIGATHNVFPSIRMQPDLMHQGAVVGGLAAHCRELGIRPEQLEGKKCRDFVRELTGDPLTLPGGNTGSLRNAVELLSPVSRTQWVDVPFIYEERSKAEMLTVMLAESVKVLPLLELRLERDTFPYDWKLQKKQQKDTGNVPLRILLIGCCLWHGDDRMAEEYADYLLSELDGDGLPGRKASVMCAQLLPDHGVMPELVYQMNLLGRSGSRFAEPVFAKVLRLLQSNRRDYFDIRSGIFHYIESFARASEHGRRERFGDWLRQLLSFEEFGEEQKGQSVLLEERLLILKLILCRALAACGEKDGKDGLLKLSHHPVMAIAVSAEMELGR